MDKLNDIKKIREDLGLTQAEFADQLGIRRELISMMENGKQPISKSTRILLNDFVVNVKKNTPTSATQPATDHSTNLIPYYSSVNASAGLTFLTKNNLDDAEMINIPNLDVQAFINVFGDSMYPKYCSGEIIGIKEVDKEFLMFGHAYVVQMKDGEVYLKYIKKGKDDKHWNLASENEKYDSRDFHLSKIDKVFIIKAIISKTAL